MKRFHSRNSKRQSKTKRTVEIDVDDEKGDTEDLFLKENRNPTDFRHLFEGSLSFHPSLRSLMIDWDWKLYFYSEAK